MSSYNNIIQVSSLQCQIIKINRFLWTQSAFSSVYSVVWDHVMIPNGHLYLNGVRPGSPTLILIQ